jgi:homoserine kinase type II
MPLESLQWEHRIIQHAAAVGVPTPLPIPTLTGASWLDWKGQHYALFPRIADDQIEREEISSPQAHAMGLFLADMEQRFADNPLSGAPCQRLVALEPGYLDKASAEIEELLLVIHALPHQGEHENLALSYLQGQRQWLTSPSHDVLCGHQYPACLIHGDFQQSNLFFSRGVVSAIIDWERARVAPWGWDIVRALHLMFELVPDLCCAFLEGYQSVVKVNSFELANTASLYGEEQDMDTWMFRAIYLEGNDRARRFLKHGNYRPFAEKWRELLPHLPL